MQWKIRMPGRMASDPRYSVTLREDGTPWPLVFHFLLIFDDETEAREWVNVGFEIGEHFESEPGSSRTPIEETPAEIDPLTLQRVATNYSVYVRLARDHLLLNQEGIGAAIKMLRGRGRTRRGLTDDFFRLIAADYEARRQAGGHPVKELAAAHHVDDSTASRWIKEARKRGYVTAEGEES